MSERSEHSLAHITDEELVVASLVGDFIAFDELVRRFRGGVTGVAEQVLGSRDAAEDVAQETFLLAFKALPQLEHPAGFAGWLYAIARHRAWRVAKRNARSEPAEPSEIDRMILACSEELARHPEEALVREAERAEIRCALAALPADHQTIIRLYYAEEWPVARISEFLMLPETTVKWRLHHGRELMRRRLCVSNGGGNDERTIARSAAGPAHAARPGTDGAGGEPDGKLSRRSAQRRLAVQPGPRSPGADR